MYGTDPTQPKLTIHERTAKTLLNLIAVAESLVLCDVRSLVRRTVSQSSFGARTIDLIATTQLQHDRQ